MRFISRTSDWSDDFWTAVIVAEAVIHRVVIADFEMDTGLRRYDVTPDLNGIGWYPFIDLNGFLLHFI